jgi:Protein of unknown function (DUF3800)
VLGGGVKHYFVDEAGDLALLDKRGGILLGKDGVSRCFMVGLVDQPNPQLAHHRLEELRHELLTDPYFRGVPSMQPEANKTALYFHAKDDPWEVKREVFKLLPSLGGKVIVAIRRKMPLAKRHAAIYKTMGKREFNPNATYDELISRIFHSKLHLADENRIVFAHRDTSERAGALKGAITKARHNFEAKRGKMPVRPTVIRSAYPYEEAGLQVVDYYLWALQRMYERREDRFLGTVESQFRLVMDLDDKRHKRYGECYTDANKLELSKIWPLTS